LTRPIRIHSPPPATSWIDLSRTSLATHSEHPFTEHQSREPLRSSKERPKASYTRSVKGIDRYHPGPPRRRRARRTPGRTSTRAAASASGQGTAPGPGSGASARVPRCRSSSSLASPGRDAELRWDRGASGSGGIGDEGEPARVWGYARGLRRRRRCRRGFGGSWAEMANDTTTEREETPKGFFLLSSFVIY
jgi:hypothetical protein